MCGFVNEHVYDSYVVGIPRVVDAAAAVNTAPIEDDGVVGTLAFFGKR
jgi:hypothetical protein